MLTGGAGNDIFEISWASGCFYDDGNAANAGRSDYVLITEPLKVGQANTKKHKFRCPLFFLGLAVSVFVA